MNRRELIKSLLPLAAIPIAAGEANGIAYKIETGGKYLFVFSRGQYVNIDSLRHLNVEGVVQYVDDPEADLKIYKVD